MSIYTIKMQLFTGGDNDNMIMYKCHVIKVEQYIQSYQSVLKFKNKVVGFHGKQRISTIPVPSKFISLICQHCITKLRNQTCLQF